MSGEYGSRAEKSRNEISSGILIGLLALSVLMGGVILYVAYWHTLRIESTIFERSASSYSSAISEFRRFYTEEITGRLSGTGVVITHDYKNLDHAIPVPATMTNDLASRLNHSSDDIKVSIVSGYPFSFRVARKLTEFEKDAFEYFDRTASKGYSKMFDEDGLNVFRYASPMIMSEGCVACHNSHPNSVKTDWRIGDVRGLQVVEIFGSDLVMENKLGFAYIFVSVVAFFVLSASMVTWLVTRSRAVESEARASLEESKAELEKTNLSLQKLAVTDFLTGIYNRQKLDEILKQEVARANRYGAPLGFAIFDLDNFKRVNDTYGHDIGDQILIEFSEFVSSRIRDTDTLGRWGGEEFIVICPETDVDGMKQLTEVIRSGVEESDFTVVGRLTASFGVTVHRKGESISELEIRADEALYEAKGSGRNCVVIK